MNIHDYAHAGDQAGVARLLSEGVPVDSARDSNGYAPLMCAVKSDQANIDLVRFLIEQGANVNAFSKYKVINSGQRAEPDRAKLAAMLGTDDERMLDTLEDISRTVDEREGENNEPVLSLAIQRGDLEIIIALLDAGADVRYQRGYAYDALSDAIQGRAQRNQDKLTTLLKLLIARGAPLDGESDYGESALSVASHRGWFPIVRLLLEAGSSAEYLGWTPLMAAIALGDLADVERELAAGSDLTARDDWERTPWLLSLQTGDVAKAKLLLAAGSNREDRGHCGKPPLQYAIENQHVDLLRWLLEEGFDPDMADEFNNTPLRQALSVDCVECVRLLLKAGAQSDADESRPLIKNATSLEMVNLLLDLGERLDDISDELRATLTRVETEGKLRVTRDEYLEGRRRRFGTANPERMEIAFWKDMVRCGVTAWCARETFDDPFEQNGDPVWCFRRFGKSLTPLPDGRFVEVAGEHEDSYDPDFCIYNEVVVHHGGGRFEIFGYPQDVFPPTDFHSATLVGEFIYLIGSLGYQGTRQPEATPVYRLHCGTWAIEKVETGGEKPGWIHRHHAVYHAEQHAIQLSGGFSLKARAKADEEDTDEEPDEKYEVGGEDAEQSQLEPQAAEEELAQTDAEPTYFHILDLATLAWRRVPAEI